MDDNAKILAVVENGHLTEMQIDGKLPYILTALITLLIKLEDANVIMLEDSLGAISDAIAAYRKAGKNEEI